MAYIHSFPTTKRESVNKLLTENSITRLINRLLDIDGFVISDGLAKKQDGVGSEVIGNGGQHLEINTNLNLEQITFKDDIFEFVLRGYYFSTGLKDFLTATNWNTYVTTHTQYDKIGLFARIYIDNTNADYPELVGQEAVEIQLNENTVDVEALNAQYMYLEDSGHPYYGIQFFICPINNEGVPDKPTPYHPSLPIDAETGTIDGLGSAYTYYDLLLIEYIRNNDEYADGSYIPFDSLSKFDSHSVRIIDGGMF